MTIGIWILGDQLSFEQSALNDVKQKQNPAQTPVILIESSGWASRRHYHKQKLVLVWSAMRHFAQELQALGYPVTYLEAETFSDPLRQWVEQHHLSQVWVMEPADMPFRQRVEELGSLLPVEMIENNHFLWTAGEFKTWAKGRKRLVMEDFYRQGRKRWQILMEKDQPLGGKWNYDSDNRQPPKAGSQFPAPLGFEPDPITQAVITKVSQQFPQAFGDLDLFRWGVTRSQALQVLDTFVRKRLAEFGPLQDAMVTGEDTMWHALISPYLNLGLLQPLEVIQAAEQMFWQAQDRIPLSSVEGFIRQVLGWREYMRGLYEWLMPQGYADHNWFDHQRPLPAFFWTGKTEMNCLAQSIDQIKRTGYAHHIQRLMVLSNFALISGIGPQAMESWFHDVFIDSYDWVMQTNVIGMGLFADGGILATKPYAASARYIHKMSDYCQNCRYNHQDKTGEDACPFNLFYWDFLIRHRQKLTQLGRMGLVLSHLKRMDEATFAQIHTDAEQWWQTHASSDETLPCSH